ncbi:YfbR-like 5'-deoxynucleotidase [Sphingomonas corticis]|uniref:Phosphohydrolase n=1 Tax=Sphingomonas corticis TaxID=2722791 RepID=A0ABX1CR54_9SPHN|nr:YfbR-like 5'-deoxynucleotidase [Sphingomonas corticis]NJR80428.1 hypothetical protein [Sphingomonas corticis]
MSDPRIKTATGPTILLASGNYFDLLDPAASRFTVGDIAQGLAFTCRFAGQCREFYSVAEHSIHTSQIVPERFALAALMHDAAEAFIGDVTRPLKSLLPDYKAIEKEIERVIFERFGLGDLPYSDEVKTADLRMLAAEQAALMPHHDDSWACIAGIEPAEIKGLGLPASPWKAETSWLQTFERLTGTYPIADLERL